MTRRRAGRLFVVVLFLVGAGLLVVRVAVERGAEADLTIRSGPAGPTETVRGEAAPWPPPDPAGPAPAPNPDLAPGDGSPAPPCVTCRGIVVDQGERPIEGAEIQWLEGTARSGADGGFSLASLGVPGLDETLVLWVRRRGYAPHVGRCNWDRADDLRIVLRRGRRIRGQVLRADERPVADCLVSVRSEVGLPWSLDALLTTVVTDASGRFELEDVATTKPCRNRSRPLKGFRGTADEDGWSPTRPATSARDASRVTRASRRSNVASWSWTRVWPPPRRATRT